MTLLVLDTISRFEYDIDKSVRSENLTDIVNFVYKAHKVDEVQYVRQATTHEQKMIDLITGKGGVDTEYSIFEMYIIYAYRARPPQEFRKQELEKHQNYMMDYLKTNFPKLKYSFVVVEQNNDLPFNRGRLLNIGFIKGMQEHKKQEKNTIPYFCMHNTDIFPLENVDYSYSNGLRDIHGYVGGIGGLTIIDFQSYNRFNGYPNNFFGWGGEDICVKDRVESLGIRIDRSCYNNKGKSRVRELEVHYRDNSQNMRNLLLAQYDKKTSGYKTNGTRQTKCVVVKSEAINTRNTITHHLIVDFE
jgi:N-terminal domain of galactosyltransferase/N-terminal region of glycosyl transferase group 7